MINELYQLSDAMNRAGIEGRTWCESYHPLPNATAKSPCIRILLSGDHIAALSALPREAVSCLRKYGDNQGTYPAMNLLPLYRITADGQKKLMDQLLRGKSIDFELQELKRWCSASNWNQKFTCGKYKISMEARAEQLRNLLSDEPDHPIHSLICQTEGFRDPQKLFRMLEEKAFEMLEEKSDIPTALRILFHPGDPQKPADFDTGSLSVIFDSEELTTAGIPTISPDFTQKLNHSLLKADEKQYSTQKANSVDAFGNSFAELERPMPAVKMAGGFTASLRTMFKGQPCQTRYGKTENASYPISPKVRTALQSALEWISEEDRRDFTWTKLEKDEILFVYPDRFPEIPISFVEMFGAAMRDNSRTFEEKATAFLEAVMKQRGLNAGSVSEHIQLFILRKLDKARTKVIYSYNTTPEELEQRSIQWSLGCKNIPPLTIGDCATLYPLEISGLLNQAWKQDGSLISDKLKPFSGYHGLELLFRPQLAAGSDLTALIYHLEVPVLSVTSRSPLHQTFCQCTVLAGLLLYCQGVRKEQYMQEFPYLYGQLLKVSDELHALYCRAVRKDGQVPPQLAGGSLYHAAADMPYQTLAQLGQRMNPYLVWARSYQYKNETKAEAESWRARWYLSIYEDLAGKIAGQMDHQSRFTDQQRAELFIGYLAAFPKKKNTSDIKED